MLRHEAAERLAEMIRRRAIPVDIRAADNVKHLGLMPAVCTTHLSGVEHPTTDGTITPPEQ